MGMHTILKLIQKNPEETARAYCVNDNADIFYPSAQTFKDSGSFHRSTLNPVLGSERENAVPGTAIE